MAQVTRRFRLLMGDLRRQAYFRSGDEKTILLGWSDALERQINRLEKGGMPENDQLLAIEALRHMRNEAEGDMLVFRSVHVAAQLVGGGPELRFKIEPTAGIAAQLSPEPDLAAARPASAGRPGVD